MAILRSGDMAGLSPAELDEQLAQLKKELMKIQGVLASGGIPEGVGRAREIKRTIARIKTVNAQKNKEGEAKGKKK
jgi:large subunit ribosomal protein L29